MKKYLLLFAISSVLIGMTSCSDFLDTNPTETYSEDLVWGSQDMIDKFVLGNYSGTFNPYLDLRTWEEKFTNNMITNKTCWAHLREQLDNTYDWGLNSRFSYIRNCNLILEKLDDPAVQAVLDDAHKAQYAAEAKMMRAMIYYDLARKGGRYMWVDEVLDVDSEFNIPLTADIVESYQHVLKDIREAIPGLPTTANTARLTKDAGYAFLSEVCLTAAAYTGDAAALQNGKSLYQEAIDAVDAISNYSESDLNADYESMFNQNNSSTSEIMLAYYRSKDNTVYSNTIMQNMIGNFKRSTLEAYGCTPYFSTKDKFECWCEFSPSQNIVDDYLVIDDQTGKAMRWDKTSQFVNNTERIYKAQVFDKQNENYIPHFEDYEMSDTSTAYKLKPGSPKNMTELMYEKRDARFDQSILRDSVYWYNELIIMRDHGNYGRWVRGNSCAGITNYMPRKYIYTDANPRPYCTVYTDFHTIIFRYSRALLNKAEALLQQNKVAEAVQVMNITRTVHGQLPPSEAANINDAWTDYKRERRCELFLESDYYWSLRRWGMYGGPANDGLASKSPIHELNIPGTFIEIKSDRTACFVGICPNQNDERRFDPRSYLFPITKSVINANSAITDADQNPGWE